MKSIHSIRTKLLFYFLLILLISSSATGILSYRVAVKNLKGKVSESYGKTLELIANNVQDNLTQIQKISDFIYVNGTVKDILSTEPGSYEHIKFKEELDGVFTNSTISNFFSNITSIKIADREEVIYSYVSYGQYDNYDNDRITDSPYFGRVLEMEDTSLQLVTGLDANYLKRYVPPEKSISLFRPIVDERFLHIEGVMFININPHMFEQAAGIYSSADDMEVDIMDDKNRILFTRTGRREEGDIRILGTVGNIRYEDDDAGQMVFVNCLDNGWKISGRVDMEELIKDNRQILMISLLGVAIAAALTVLAWVILSSMFIRPVRELKQVMKNIRTGDFSVRARVVSRDELGDLTVDFNYMIDTITTLFEKQLDDKSRLKDAQYMALQAQINPHFLYNTLNSIRWMAIIQKEDNIKKAVDALVKLLRSTTGRGEMTTVGESVETLKSYTFIQQMAYRCKFHIVWEVDETIVSCICMKFLLQPLVENAIYHGIEPKEGTGTIAVTIRAEVTEGEECLYFEVIDDGVGMTQQQIENILEKTDTTVHTFTGIGVNNVNERLILMYGTKYRLHFESELGKFCRVWFVIPREEGGKDAV